MPRANQIILIGSFIPFCWLAFMGVHELGHVAAGVLTGGTIKKIVWHPFAISRTDVVPNPSPLVTAWAGPSVGALLPLAIWIVFHWFKIPGSFLVRFFAGFCLIANGVYIGIGSFDKVGDAGDLIRHGSPLWSLWIFGIVAVASGFTLWHRLGPKFGLGEAKGYVDERAAYTALGLFVVVYLMSFCLSERF